MTTMLFAMALPNWNSLDSVRRAHSDLEFTALVFFAFLVVFDVLAHLANENLNTGKLFERIGLCCFAIAVLAEIMAYPYGRRDDALSEQVIGSLDAKARDASDAAGQAKEKAGKAECRADAAGKAADEAQEKVKGVAEQADKIGGVLGETVGLINARQVRGADKLSAELKKHFEGRKVQLVSYVGDVEAWGLCTQLVKVAANAEMIPEDICGKAWFTSPLISPLSITATNWDEALEISQSLLKIGRLGSTFTIGSALVIFAGVKSPFVIGETAQTRDAERRAAAMKKSGKPSAK